MTPWTTEDAADDRDAEAQAVPVVPLAEASERCGANARNLGVLLRGASQCLDRRCSGNVVRCSVRPPGGQFSNDVAA